MNEYTLYRNMKRWLFTYGNELLDLLLPVYDPDTLIPSQRYHNLSEEFDKHFNLLAYYSMQAQPHLPVILVEFDDITYNSCFRKYAITFHVYFQVISPIEYSDNEIIIANSPESILEYRERITCALRHMVEQMGVELRNTIFNNEPWGYPLYYDTDKWEEYKLNGKAGDEILHFSLEVELSDNKSHCS